MENMKRMCKEIVSGKDIVEIDCEPIECSECVFSFQNNIDKIDCSSRRYNHNILIAKRFLEEN